MLLPPRIPVEVFVPGHGKLPDLQAEETIARQWCSAREWQIEVETTARLAREARSCARTERCK